MTRLPVSTTFPLLMRTHAAQRPHAPALRAKQRGIWQTLSWAQLDELVAELACGMADAGVTRGAHVALIGDNRPRLQASMLALQSMGAIPVPLYPEATARELEWPLHDADVRFAIVQDQEQVDKLLLLRAHHPALSRVWYDMPRGLRHYDAPGLAPLDALIERGRERHASEPRLFDERLARVDADDVAGMFYTSGTTGRAKGVVHTHRSLIDRADATRAFDKLDADEEVLACLPPAWTGQHSFSYAQWLVCGYVVNCPESPDTVAIDLKEIGPTYYFGPPRVLEDLLTVVTMRMADAGRLRRWLFDTAMRVARRVADRAASASLRDRLLHAIGDLVVHGPLRNTLGLSRVRVAYTAGDAVDPELIAFYRSIGVNLKQLYGSTETAMFVCMQPDDAVRPDTVGVPVGAVEIRLSDTGEVLVRSPGLLREYHKDPAATAAALDADGWYRTGDAGLIDDSGQLKIIDRAKDVGRLADGSLFAPRYIESKLRFFPYIKQAVVVGEGRERVCALINIDFDAVGRWAERRGVVYGGYADLAQRAEVGALIGGCVEKINAALAADGRLAGSQIARFVVLHKELDADDGELTRTHKLRRGFIADKYRVLIDALYERRSSQRIETSITLDNGHCHRIEAELPLIDVRLFEPGLRRAA